MGSVLEILEICMHNIREILKQLADQEITLEDAEQALKIDYLERLEDLAQLDMGRQARTGIPEVIFAESKDITMVNHITAKMLEKNRFALLSRVRPEQARELRSVYQNKPEISYEEDESARIIYIAQKSFTVPQRNGHVGIITAGTSDIPIAKEAEKVLKVMGIKTTMVIDVGIAGLHRIFKPIQSLIQEQANVVIVVAGMEGTLPGVVSALVDLPVIGVPTSTGYGWGEKGKGALTTMLQSCSPGLSVVNIDNGFGAACMAALIVQQINKHSE